MVLSSLITWIRGKVIIGEYYSISIFRQSAPKIMKNRREICFKKMQISTNKRGPYSSDFTLYDYHVFFEAEKCLKILKFSSSGSVMETAEN